eukprot:UN2875
MSLAVRLKREARTRTMKTTSISSFLSSSRRFPRACSTSTKAAFPPSSAGIGNAFTSARLRFTVTKKMPSPSKPSAKASSSPCWTMPTGPTTSPGPKPLRTFWRALNCSPRIRATNSPATPAASWKLAAFTKVSRLLLMIITPKRCRPVSGSVSGMASSCNCSPPRLTKSSTGVWLGRP